MKNDKDQIESSSYRPIDLLESDLQVFDSILDQVGFITRRFSLLMSVDNKYYTQNKSKSAVFMLDVHKAFDPVEWRYLLLTIREFVLGQVLVHG